MKDIRVIMAFIACMVGIMNVCFLEPILAIRIMDFGYK